jgi:pilus assembly protein CpaE
VFRSIVICPDRELSTKLNRALEASGAVNILRTSDKYPTPAELPRNLRGFGAEILFLSFERVDKALELMATLDKEASQVQVVAVHKSLDPQLLREGMRAGVREFLVEPFERKAVWDSLTHLKDLLEKHPVQYETTNRIYTFFPSKAGAGTSTIALNVSAAMARKQRSNVLLSDFDLNSGMVRFLLQLNNPHSVPEACEHCDELDETLWPQLVTSLNGLDVLHAGRINPHIRIEPAQVRTLLGFMRRNYETLCFDTSGNLERYSVELMQESKRVFLVCTPEIPSLHQAREKMAFLRELELDTRVSVILNRAGKKPLFTNKQVADIVGAPVVRSMPNDYQGVSRALTNGTLVEPESDLGRAYAEFAGSLFDEEQPSAATPTKVEIKRKFMEFLAVRPNGSSAVAD